MWNLQQRARRRSPACRTCRCSPPPARTASSPGVLLTRAYHEDRGEHRHKVLTPDTAHGTNPATVTMAGLEVVKVATNADGGVDIDDLRAKADEDVACLMLTNPNTLGLFDPNIEEIADDRPRRRRDALLRRRQPQRRDGHLAARATWASTSSTSTCTSRSPSRTAAAARAPARSRSRDRIAPYLPVPRRRAQRDGRHASTSTTTAPKSIGRLRGFQGNYGCFVRSYAYICSLGADGLRDASETAVLNANYLLARLRELGVAEHLPLAFGELCMHEFVLSGGADEARPADQDARPRQAAARLRLPPADRLLPAARRRGADGRADRDRDARRRSTRFAEAIAAILAEAARGPGDRPAGALHDAGAPPRRGRGGQAAR